MVSRICAITVSVAVAAMAPIGTSVSVEKKTPIAPTVPSIAAP